MRSVNHRLDERDSVDNAKLITVDDGFRRYRRLRNQVITLVMPEGG